MRFVRKSARSAVCAVLGASLAICGVSHAPRPACAETSQEVREQAAREHARLDELAEQMAATREELDEYEAQIDELANESVKVQGQLIEDRGALSSMVDTTYRWGTPSIVDIAFSSKTIEDFVSRLYYARRVTEWQTACVEDLRADKEQLQEHMNEIEEARSERERAAEELDEAYEEVSQTVDSLMARAATLEKEEREAEERRIAEAARKAEAERQRKSDEQAKAEAQRIARDEAASQIKDARAIAQKNEAAAGGAQQQEPQAQEAQGNEAQAQDQEDREPQAQETQAADQGQEEQGASGEASQPTHVEVPSEDAPIDDAGDWITCIASAYTIADNDPPGTTATASGIPLDESVPTVALPMSMGPSRFYGQRIQIEYQGMTVVATITDCGDLDGGNRGLDITPAIFRAFGASTADEWGLRTVRYRFL